MLLVDEPEDRGGEFLAFGFGLGFGAAFVFGAARGFSVLESAHPPQSSRQIQESSGRVPEPLRLR